MAKETEKKVLGQTPAKQMVEIPKSQLDEILKSISDLKSDRDVLLQVADKKALGNYYQRNRGKIPSHIMLRVMDTRATKDSKAGEPPVEKVIVGWRTVQDEVYQDPLSMKWMEKQRLMVIYEDGMTEEFWLMDYIRKYRQVEAEVRGKITDELTGDLALKVVRLDNQKEYTIGVTYIN
jgi:lipoate-protein ligase A